MPNVFCQAIHLQGPHARWPARPCTCSFSVAPGGRGETTAGHVSSNVRVTRGLYHISMCIPVCWPCRGFSGSSVQGWGTGARMPEHPQGAPGLTQDVPRPAPGGPNICLWLPFRLSKALGGLLSAYSAILCALWSYLRAILELLDGHIGRSQRHLGLLRAVLTPSLGHLLRRGPLRGHLGAIWASWCNLGPSQNR